MHYKIPPSFLKARTFAVPPAQKFGFAVKPKPKLKAVEQEMPAYEDMPDTPDAVGSYRKGSKVRHPTYGVGSVVQVEGAGEEEKLAVMFSNHQIKKFVTKYARLEKV
jgi:hypothetical protein